jgi:ribosome biogenesis GTPase
MSTLEELGCTPEILRHAEKHIKKGFSLARVVEEHRQRYSIQNERFEMTARIAGRMMYRAASRNDYPAVGDWVLASGYENREQAVIQYILPRTTLLERKAPGKRTENQIIATNIDEVFIVLPLDQTFNPGKLERALVLVRESGALPVVALSKIDLCPPEKLPSILTEAQTACGRIPLIAYCAFDAGSLRDLCLLIRPKKTYCLIGPSGSGKSTLINILIGSEILPTGEVRSFDAKGRHTTSARQLLVRAAGGIFIDTPGIREIGLWETGSGLQETFDDIDQLAQECRFRDCTHNHEPLCAVRRAVEEGSLSPGRHEHYLHLQKELHRLDSKIVQGRGKKTSQKDRKSAGRRS